VIGREDGKRWERKEEGKRKDERKKIIIQNEGVGGF